MASYPIAVTPSAFRVGCAYPALLRMWDKRQRGYRAMGYRVGMAG